METIKEIELTPLMKERMIEASNEIIDILQKKYCFDDAVSCAILQNLVDSNPSEAYLHKRE